MEILRELNDGLVIRSATPDDTAALVEMQIHAFANPDTKEPDIYLGGWTRDLMSGKHPTFQPQDFLIVQDTRANKIVSCMCLLSQTWSLAVTPNAQRTESAIASERDDIAFKMGRPEIVGTDAAYRNRGLVREQFRVLHEISARRGEMVQAITGIPLYYRQFGYEYAIELVAPRQSYIPQHIPELKMGETEKFRVRRATREDLNFILEMYKRACERSYVSCQRDVKNIEWENFLENDALNGNATWWDVIESAQGERAGIVRHRRYVFRGRHTIDVFEIAPQFSWQAVTPSVLRELTRQARELESEDKQPLARLAWFLQSNHPLFEIMPESTAPYYGGYAWYVRVADLPAFLTHIAPLLEKRIAASEFRFYSDTLRLNFYRDGVEMIFENGKLKTAQAWRATANDFGFSGFGNAAFPDLTFLKLLFGYRSRAELQNMFPDCLLDNDTTAALLDVLFPKQVSNLLPIH